MNAVDERLQSIGGTDAVMNLEQDIEKIAKTLQDTMDEIQDVTTVLAQN